MRQFKTPYEITKMTAKEMLDYRQHLRNVLRVMRKELDSLNKCWDELKYELEFLHFKLQKDLKVAESKRLSAESESELNKLNVH